MSFDFRGQDADLMLNGRTRPRYYNALYNRGGILVRDSLRAENRPSTGSGLKNDDSFGQFTFRNYFGARSVWTRQTVLTAEGFLVVRDCYEPCPDVDAYVAAPCWMLKAEGEVHRDGRNWFDAPARDHSWWQNRKKRVLLYLHPGQGLMMGQLAHRVSADIQSGASHTTFARATIKAGRPQVWLSVLRPFDDGQDAAEIAATMETRVDETGRAHARIGPIEVTIDPAGSWTVTR